MSEIQPQELAEFEVVHRLGAGGMAEVFLAKKRGAEGTFKLLVVKRILPEHAEKRRFRSMFIEEAHLATRLNHPNIVQVYEFSDHARDGLLLSMEYVEGFDLGKLIASARRQGTPIPPFIAAFIVAEAAKGLHYAHERRDESGVPLAIVHRDVSPQNILVSNEGAIKIADFGIASANLFREETGILKGKFSYMSPEQARGQRVDRRSDVYALGVVFHELLTLRSPYGALAGEALLEAVRAGRVDRPSVTGVAIPGDLEAIAVRALSADREERFQTARDMSGAILRALLATREVIDNASVEATLAEIIGHDARGPSADEAAHLRTIATANVARGAGDASSLERRPRFAARLAREVRHIAVVSIRIDGLRALEGDSDRPRALRPSLGVRPILDDIAYKHGAVLSWDATSSSARAIVGLMGNPSRAATDAAELALDTHEALAGASEDLPVTLRAAISIVRGIATGTRDEHGHLIDHTLEEPAHFLVDSLSARTPFGQTWVAGGLFRLVRREFRWSDAPTLDLDGAERHGAPAAMRVHALRRKLSREERLAELASSPRDLVGRSRERADLHAAFHRATTPVAEGHRRSGSRGQGRFVAQVIAGEMGIGKTALLHAFLSELPSHVRTIRTDCSPVKIELPFATVGDLLRDATGITLDTAAADAASAFAALLGPIADSPNGTRIVERLSELATGRQSDSDGEGSARYLRDLVVSGVRLVLGALSKKEPLIIAIDSVQWADRESIDLFKELVRGADDVPMLCLLASRPDDRVAPYLQEFVRTDLQGLNLDEQRALVEARLGVTEGVAEACDDLFPRAAGNPFFLLELVDAMLERGALEIVEQAPRSGDTSQSSRVHLVRRERGGSSIAVLPSTLEQRIDDRLSELPPAEREIVDWLAVAGGPLAADDLVTLLRLVGDEPITRLCARGLCERRSTLVDFRLPLARDVAYQALSHQGRVRIHRLLGEHLATTNLARGMSAAIVARHLARGEARSAAAEFYLEAGSAARSAHDPRLSVRYFERALELLPAQDPKRINAHEALESVYRHLGKRRERRRHLDGLKALARHTREARWVSLALVRAARLELEEGHLARALPSAERGAMLARRCGHAAGEVEAQTLRAEILRDSGDVQGALAACEEALAVAGSAALGERLRAEVLRTKGVLLRYLGRIHEALDAYVEALAAFQAAGARRQEARARNSIAYAMFVLERFEDAIAMGTSSLRVDLAIGGRFQIAKTLSNIGQAYARMGDLPRGLAFLERARDAHERYGDKDSRADTLLCSAEVLLEAGDIAAATTLAGDAGALVAVTGTVYDAVHAEIIRARVARATHETDLARHHASRARTLAEAQGLASFAMLATALEAAARVELGETHAGAMLARTALASIEAPTASEYGLEIRALVCEALVASDVVLARDACVRAATHVERVAAHIRNSRLRSQFRRRAVVENIVHFESAFGGEQDKDNRE